MSRVLPIAGTVWRLRVGQLPRGRASTVNEGHERRYFTLGLGRCRGAAGAGVLWKIFRHQGADALSGRVCRNPRRVGTRLAGSAAAHQTILPGEWAID